MFSQIAKTFETTYDAHTLFLDAELMQGSFLYSKDIDFCGDAQMGYTNAKDIYNYGKYIRESKMNDIKDIDDIEF